MTVKILLADDHPMIRHGLRNLLNGVNGLQVIAEANDGLEAVREIDLRKPDILVVDLMMPNLNGLDVLAQVKRLSPATRIIVFSMQSAAPYVIAAFRNGALGYILKETGATEIVEAIRAVMRGERYTSARIAGLLEMDDLREQHLPPDLYETLTSREREVLQMTSEGKSSTEIGEKLVISPRTVEIHRGRLMKKLNLRNQAELIRYAIRKGILPVDD